MTVSRQNLYNIDCLEIRGRVRSLDSLPSTEGFDLNPNDDNVEVLLSKDHLFRFQGRILCLLRLMTI